MWKRIKSLCSRSYESLNNSQLDNYENNELDLDIETTTTSPSVDNITKSKTNYNFRQICHSGYVMIPFEDVLNQESKLSSVDIERYADIYSSEILGLYKTTVSSTGQPLFKSAHLHTRLIKALSQDVIKHLKLFHLVGLNKNQRPIISIANHCSFKKAKGLILGYQKNFIEYILPRLCQRVQFLILTIFKDYITIPSCINYLKLREKYKRKYPNIRHLAFYILMKTTGNYLPEVIHVSNFNKFIYIYTNEKRDSILWC